MIAGQATVPAVVTVTRTSSSSPAVMRQREPASLGGYITNIMTWTRDSNLILGGDKPEAAARGGPG